MNTPPPLKTSTAKTPISPQSWAVAGGALLALGLLAWLLAPVLTPFIVALVLAWATHGLVDALEKSPARDSHNSKGATKGAAGKLFAWLPRLPRALAAVLVVVLLFMCAASFVLLIVPIVAKEWPLLVGAVQAKLPQWLDNANAHLAPWLSQLGLHGGLDLASLKAWLQKLASGETVGLGQVGGQIGSQLGQHADTVGNLGAGILNAVLGSLKVGSSVALTLVGNLVLTPVALFYLLLSWPKLTAKTSQLIPLRWQSAVQSFMTECNAMLGQYLRGQLLVMVALAVFYSAGLWLFGLDLALPIGVFTGLAMCIPYVGFGVGLLLALLAGLLQFTLAKTLVMLLVVYGVGQLIEGFILTPRLVGERIGLHPLAVIFALLAFGQLFGFVGVLIALPASAVLVVALRRARAVYLQSVLYRQT